MQRQRARRGTAVQFCRLCAQDRTAVLFESWAGGGLLRRRRDVAWRWECQSCGARTTVSTREPAGV